MPFLPPNQQRQSTEGTSYLCMPKTWHYLHLLMSVYCGPMLLAVQQLIDIFYPPDPQQQSHRTPLQQANRTDRRTDKW